MSTQTKMEDIKKLEVYLKKINESRYDIRQANKLIEDMQENFQKFLVSDYTSIAINHMELLKEPDQNTDSKIMNTVNYIQREINALNKEITTEKVAKEAAEKTKHLINGNNGFNNGGFTLGGW